MDNRISIIVLSKSEEISDKLNSDLDVLRFKSANSAYPKVNVDDIYYQYPDIVLIDLTVVDHDAYKACDLLATEGALPQNTALTALVSESSMGQVPMAYIFNEIISYPYDLTELGFRLRRIVSRNLQEAKDDTIRIGDISLSPSRYQVKVDGSPIVFSYKEYQLFKYLITHQDRVFTREKLLENIWGETLVNGVRTVDVHIRRIRAKIGDIENKYIKTVRGVGYTFSYEG